MSAATYPQAARLADQAWALATSLSNAWSRAHGIDRKRADRLYRLAQKAKARAARRDEAAGFAAEPALCGACNGSGEGAADGTRCSICRGRGELHS